MSDNASSRLAAIRAKFQGGAANVPTPENQFGKMKKSQEAQARAVRVAKARAARYNMTLRALAIKTTTDVTKMQQNDQTAKKETAAKAAKYNATARAINVGMSVQDSRNLSKSFGENVAPSIAKEVINEVAKRNVVKATKVPKPDKSGQYVQHKPKARPTKPTPVEEEDVPTDDESVQEAAHKTSVKIENKGLQESIAAGDENQLNKTILNDFLEANAPHLLPKADVFLSEFQDEMHILFKKLLKKFPDAADAEIAGEQKADAEIAAGVNANAGAKAVAVAPTKAAPAAKAAPAPVEEDDDDSMVFDEDQIEAFDPETDKVAEMKFSDEALVKAKGRGQTHEADDDDDDDSLVIEEADKAFQESYEKAIAEAETAGPDKALARRKSSQKANDDLEAELARYKAGQDDDDDSFKSVISDDSLVQLDPAAAGGNPGYIVVTEVAPAKKEEEEGRWAVHFQHKNLALKEKLMKQGLPTNQVAKMVGDLDTYTSDMI